MKKTFAMLIALALVSTSFAVSVNWGITGADQPLPNYTSGVAAGTTVYFLYGDATSINALLASDTATKADFLSDLASITLHTVTANNDGKKPTVSTIVNIFDGRIQTSNNSFGMLYYSEDAAGNGYYKISYGTSTGYNYDPEDGSVQREASISWLTMKNSAWTQAYAAVPEPATAGLAIAGLALLFKRRRK